MKISSFHKRKQIEPAYIKFRFTNEMKSEPLYLGSMIFFVGLEEKSYTQLK